MQKTVLGITAIAALIGTPAFAADVAVKAPPAPAPLPTYSWTGFYVGGTAGGAWSEADPNLSIVNGAPPLFRPADLGPIAAFGSQKISGANAILGAKAGYNQQWGSFVAGLEGDISWSHLNQSRFVTGNPFTAPAPPPDFASFSNTISTTWLATLRPRVGYAVNQTLFYATGGLAFANVRFSDFYNAFSPLGNASGDVAAGSTSQTRTGWAAGGGIDYAISSNWIVSAEYLHIDLGSVALSAFASSGNTANASLNYSTKLHSDIARAGVSYKF